jgi:Tol biopolymer transport system component
MRLALVAALLALLGLLAIQAGAPRLPAPFGPAANGLIAYGEANDVVVADPRTGVARALLPGPSLDHDPVFSPDGRAVAAIRDLGLSRVDVLVVDADGSNVRRATTVPLTDLSWMDWSPDSKWVVAVSAVGGVQSLQLFSATGSGASRVLVDDMDVITPVFRPPAGDEILFAGRANGKIGLYVVRADGTGRRMVIAPRATSNPDRDLIAAHYAPDGRRIAVQTWSTPGSSMRVSILDANGTGATGFELQHDPGAWYEGWPDWSPDGTRIAILRLFVDSNGAKSLDERPVAIVPVDTAGPAIETGPIMSGNNRSVDWSPDGRYLIMRSDDNPQLLLDPGGGPSTALPWTSRSMPSWQRRAP